VTRVGASESGQRASFNRDRDLTPASAETHADSMQNRAQVIDWIPRLR